MKLIEKLILAYIIAAAVYLVYDFGYYKGQKELQAFYDSEATTDMDVCARNEEMETE